MSMHVPAGKSSPRNAPMQLRSSGLLTWLSVSTSRMGIAIRVSAEPLKATDFSRPLARVVVGGMISSAVVILLVLPAIYLLAHRWLEQRRPQTEFNHPGRGGVVEEG